MLQRQELLREIAFEGLKVAGFKGALRPLRQAARLLASIRADQGFQLYKQLMEKLGGLNEKSLQRAGSVLSKISAVHASAWGLAGGSFV